jgi:hypothetical protein
MDPDHSKTAVVLTVATSRAGEISSDLGGMRPLPTDLLTEARRGCSSALRGKP